jgi:2-oxoglutarate ferredoxin oxidoreductase subunit beta
VLLKKLEKDYDPTDKAQAYQILENAQKNGWLVTGLIYIDPEEPTMHDHFNLIDRPLNRMTSEEIRPSKESLDMINGLML